MSIEVIFQQIKDPAGWPEPPPRAPRPPADAADLKPAELVALSPEALERWILAAREAHADLLKLKAD
jgi:hypothetical protein